MLASLRAELLVMRKRPAVWALVLALPADMLIYTYVTEYVYYRSASHGLTLDVNAVQILADMLPGQYLTSALSGLGPYSDVYGAAIFVLLGALIAGSDYTAIGLALGTVLRSAIKATAVVPLWTVLIQPNLDQLSTQLHGTLLRLYEILPDASVNTLVNLDNSNTTFAPGAGLEPATGAQIAPVLAVVILCLYLTVFLAIPAVLTRRRSIS